MLTLITFTSVFILCVSVYVYANNKTHIEKQRNKDLEGQLDLLQAKCDRLQEDADIAYFERNRSYEEIKVVQSQRDRMIDAHYELDCMHKRAMKDHADTIMELQSLQAHHDACTERRLTDTCDN